MSVLNRVLASLTQKNNSTTAEAEEGYLFWGSKISKKRNLQNIEIEEEEIGYRESTDVRLVGSSRQLKQTLKILKKAGFKWQSNGTAYPVKNKFGENTGKYALLLKKLRQESNTEDEDGAIFIGEGDDD